jgi:hypothetical protein
LGTSQKNKVPNPKNKKRENSPMRTCSELIQCGAVEQSIFFKVANEFEAKTIGVF